jgi:predicted nucleic acid-binding protein
VTQVFDASAIVAALIDDGAEGHWCEDQLLVDDLVAPHLMPIEAANIIRRTEARKAIGPSDAAAAVRDLRRLDVELVHFEPLADRAWDLRANLTVYDACYVATAEIFRCRLVTLDRKLAKAPGLRCEVVVALTGDQPLS